MSAIAKWLFGSMFATTKPILAISFDFNLHRLEISDPDVNHHSKAVFLTVRIDTTSICRPLGFTP